MAQYSVTYSCGHTGTEHLYGRTSERENRLQWLQAFGLCPGCYAANRQQQRETANSESARWAAENGLPVLQGTEKQCSWAETIRREKLARIELIGKSQTNTFPAVEGDELALRKMVAEKPFDPFAWNVFADWTEEHAEDPKLATAWAAEYRAIAWLIGQDQAKWWIDNRYDDAKSLVRKRIEEPERLAREEAERKRRAEEAAAAEKAKQEEAQKLWEEKDRIARTIHSLLNTDKQRVTEIKVGEWSGARRVYVGKGFGKTQATYHHTGDSRNKPGSMDLPDSFAEVLGDRVDEFKAILSNLCSKWRQITIRVGDDGGAANG